MMDILVLWRFWLALVYLETLQKDFVLLVTLYVEATWKQNPAKKKKLQKRNVMQT